MYRTVDGAKTWKLMTTDLVMFSLEGEISGLQFVDSRNGFVLRTIHSPSGQEVLLRTGDGGSTWKLVPTAIPVR
jgi:photosystem II stability/assembly factor-like uncharacterized protein